MPFSEWTFSAFRGVPPCQASRDTRNRHAVQGIHPLHIRALGHLTRIPRRRKERGMDSRVLPSLRFLSNLEKSVKRAVCPGTGMKPETYRRKLRWHQNTSSNLGFVKPTQRAHVYSRHVVGLIQASGRVSTDHLVCSIQFSLGVPRIVIFSYWQWLAGLVEYS